MSDDETRTPTYPPEASGPFVLRKTLDALSLPLFRRLGELLEPDLPSFIVAVAAQRTHSSPEAGCDWIRGEACRRALPHWAAKMQLAPEDVQRGLDQIAAQLAGLAAGQPKRVLLSLAALERGASEPADAFRAAAQALAMPRNTLDKNKSRALDRAREGTCLAGIPGHELGVLPLFCVSPPLELVEAGRKLHAALDGDAGKAADRAAEAHAEANRRRRDYEAKRRSAQALWRVQLAEALDQSGVTPLAAEQRFVAAARAARKSAEQIARSAHDAWHALRLADAVPRRLSAEVTWAWILSDAPRPSLFALGGAWARFVADLGPGPRHALDALAAAAQEAEQATLAWNDAQERAYCTAGDHPVTAAVARAVLEFNAKLDQALSAVTKGIAR